MDAVHLTYIVDRHDMRMFQPCNATRLLAEAGDVAGIVGEVGWENLERNDPIKVGLVGFVDNRHTTPPQFGNNLEAAKGCADQVLLGHSWFS